MNCKQGDLAVITRIPPYINNEKARRMIERLLGTVVRVVKYACSEGIDSWYTEETLTVTLPSGRSLTLQGCPDCSLTPIRGLDEPETITTKEPEHADA